MNWSNLVSMVENRKNREEIYSRPEFWDEKSRRYRGDAVSMWPNNHLNALYGKEQFQLLDDWLPNLQGVRLLDIGCGTGRLSRYLAKKDAKVTGLDFSKESIQLARSLSKNSNIQFRVQSVFELDECEEYEVALSWGGVLAVACRNTSELAEALTRIHTSLRDGSMALFLEPVHRGFLHRVLNASPDEFSKTLAKCGFVIEEVRTLHFWPARLLLSYVPWPKWITLPCYHTGQFLMRLAGGRKFGDYYAFRCRKAKAGDVNL